MVWVTSKRRMGLSPCHGAPQSYDTIVLLSSVKLRVLRGKKFFLDSPECAVEGKGIIFTICTH